MVGLAVCRARRDSSARTCIGVDDVLFDLRAVVDIFVRVCGRHGCVEFSSSIGGGVMRWARCGDA